MNQEIRCEKCNKLFMIVAGDSESGWTIESFGIDIHVEAGAIDEQLAWAICHDCDHRTPFDASFLPPKPRKPQQE